MDDEPDLSEYPLALSAYRQAYSLGVRASSEQQTRMRSGRDSAEEEYRRMQKRLLVVSLAAEEIERVRVAIEWGWDDGLAGESERW